MFKRAEDGDPRHINGLTEVGGGLALDFVGCLEPVGAVQHMPDHLVLVEQDVGLDGDVLLCC